MNQDPIGFGGGINVYSYAGNNPVNEVDPSGLDDGEPGYWAQAWGFFKGEMRALNPINWVAGPSQALGYLDGQGWSWEAFKHVGGGFIDGLEFWNKDDSGAAGESFMGDVLLLTPLIKKIPNFTGIEIPDIPPIEIGAFRFNIFWGLRIGGDMLVKCTNKTLADEGQRWRIEWHPLPDNDSIPKSARGRSLPHWHDRGPGGIEMHRPWQKP